MIAASITITYELAEDGDLVTGVNVEGDAPLVVLLGLLRLAEDTIIRDAMEDGQ